MADIQIQASTDTKPIISRETSQPLHRIIAKKGKIATVTTKHTNNSVIPIIDWSEVSPDILDQLSAEKGIEEVQEGDKLYVYFTDSDKSIHTIAVTI